MGTRLSSRQWQEQQVSKLPFPLVCFWADREHSGRPGREKEPLTATTTAATVASLCNPARAALELPQLWDSKDNGSGTWRRGEWERRGHVSEHGQRRGYFYSPWGLQKVSGCCSFCVIRMGVVAEPLDPLWMHPNALMFYSIYTPILKPEVMKLT